MLVTSSSRYKNHVPSILNLCLQSKLSPAFLIIQPPSIQLPHRSNPQSSPPTIHSGSLDNLYSQPTMFANTIPQICALVDSVRHGMAGWWKCCRCDNMNNPALCGGRCTICGHIKDDSCGPV
ncbi:hypothetical protein BDV09DRAFT_25460 [Aspergillus tetrazonus]